jgi:hypothetical protein
MIQLKKFFTSCACTKKNKLRKSRKTRRRKQRKIVGGYTYSNKRGSITSKNK